MKKMTFYFLNEAGYKEVATLEEALTLYKEIRAKSEYIFAKVIYFDAEGIRYELAN